MNDWQQVGSQDTGNWWTNEAEGMSAFEDVQESEPRWYAWMGTVDDHDNAEHSSVQRSLVQAVVNIP